MVDAQEQPQKARVTTAIVAARQAPLTSIAVLMCIVIFFGIASEPDRASWTALARWGWLPPNAIYDGAYWALVSSAFVHADALHLAANLPCLWLLGSCLERTVGVWRWLLFFVASAFISSALQLFVIDEMGVGVSGVVYAMAGFMWCAREQYPQFKQAITKRIMVLFLIWLVASLVLTRLHLLNIGNVAHIAGLVFGALVALHSIAWYRGHIVRAGLLRAGLGLLIALAILPLFWAPWSIVWLSNQAYHAHREQHYKEALSYYDRIIELNPQNAWAFYNRSSVYSAIGNTGRAQADLDQALQLDPTIGQQE